MNNCNNLMSQNSELDIIKTNKEKRDLFYTLRDCYNLL